MTTLNQGFERLAERFRRVADRTSNAYGIDEYNNTCAAACLLLQRLKAEGTLPYLDLTLWQIALENLGDSVEDFVKKEKMQATCWEMEAVSLCRQLPENCGLPSNPMLWKKEPNGDGLFAKGSEVWGSKAENWATVCDWIVKNVSAFPPKNRPSHGLADDFRRLAERFRTIAKNSDSESGPLEYKAAAAAAFSLSLRLKSVGTLPYWNIQNWNIKGDTNRHMSHREKSQYETVHAGHWESFVMRILCERVPISNGLPINPQAYQRPDENGCIGRMETRWRPLCENSARVCDWVADNMIVMRDDNPEKMDRQLDSETFRFKKESVEANTTLPTMFVDSVEQSSSETKPRKKRGRKKFSKKVIDQDRRIFEAWEPLKGTKGVWKTLAHRFGITEDEAKLAQDRHRHRIP